ncbi:MAG: tetratricopeptide repeat protein [Xanthomonadales bacterium]|nr:tetratricopeptide repeat protein [Xanthomonadales bacterium]NIQ24460.1 tetratricopeptide repeat protein [Stutzerimonas stutzeri]NIN58454.1 tetratricopeptide repeat protein [Xanthomonadales bacterium]NIN75138.1 tetratricopeptide repeat protein [Xanthomonadales bacterium]NIO12724.1 tetratricopeptide repeat protein [Xanthomonadales bacterium]
MSLFAELKRRNVFKVGAAYLVMAWLVMQVADVVLNNIAAPDWVFRVILLLLGVGFLLAVFFAWAFELTPEGIKREHEVDRSRSITHQTGRKLNFGLAALLTLALAYLAYDKLLTEPPAAAPAHPATSVPRAPSAKAVAVLPFANLSSDPEQEYFSDGITEEIISKLARIEDLPVASRTSVLRFKDSTLDIREIAAALGVRYVLEGSVRKAGSQLRITAQLIDSETGFHVWSKDFDGNVEEVFDVQESTAIQIAEALDIHLSPQDRAAVQRRYTSNSEAYDAYLRGLAHLMEWSEMDDLQSARAYFERALELEPEYPPALAGLASMEAQTYRNHDPSERRLLRGIELANQALELDPGLVSGHIALGELAAIRYDYRGAAAEFRRAIDREPDNAMAWDLLSWALAYQQPPDGPGAEAAANKAIELAPEYYLAYYHLGRALNLQGRFDEAIDMFMRIGEFNPGSDVIDLGLAQSYLAMGDLQRAREHAEASLAGTPSPINLSYLCFVEAAEGNRDAALACLQQLLEQNYRDFETLEASPHLQALRTDPRYRELIDAFR